MSALATFEEVHIPTDAEKETAFLNAFATSVAVPEKCTVSECADEFRILSKKNAEPGPFVTDRVPYLRGYQDLFGDANIDKIVVKKSSQSAFSEGARNGLLYWVRNDPGNVLWLFPNREAVKKTFKKHLIPMVNSDLKDYLTGKQDDVGLNLGIYFSSMDLTPGWSGSPQATASDPYRYVVCDEINKFPEWSGNDANPVDLAEARTRTYGKRKKIVLISTPTVAGKGISVQFESIADKRYFWVPCLNCKEHQILNWSQVRWPKRDPETDYIEHADSVLANNSAVYVCKHCDYEHRDSQRQLMVTRGEWRSVLKDTSTSRSVALHISALYSPWTSLSELVAKFLKALKKGAAAMMEFYNQELGEDYKNVTNTVKVKVFEEKRAKGHKRLLVPYWASRLIATADTQKNGHPFIIRAWGFGYRSRLIEFNHAADLEMLRSLTLDRKFTIVDDEGNETAETIAPVFLGIDSGGGIIDDQNRSSTDLVYRFSLTDPAHIFALKGHGGNQKAKTPMDDRRHNYKVPGTNYSYTVHYKILDPDHYKDILSSYIQSVDGDQWQVCEDIDDNYVAQMTSEHRTVDLKSASKVERWVVKSQGTPNHYWDCEYMNRALADLLNCEHLPTPKEQLEWLRSAAKARSERDHGTQNKKENPYLRGRGSWIRDGGRRRY